MGDTWGYDMVIDGAQVPNTSATHTSTLELKVGNFGKVGRFLGAAEVVLKTFPFEDPSVDAIEAQMGQVPLCYPGS